MSQTWKPTKGYTRALRKMSTPALLSEARWFKEQIDNFLARLNATQKEIERRREREEPFFTHVRTCPKCSKHRASSNPNDFCEAGQQLLFVRSQALSGTSYAMLTILPAHERPPLVLEEDAQ